MAMGSACTATARAIWIDIKTRVCRRSGARTGNLAHTLARLRIFVSRRVLCLLGRHADLPQHNRQGRYAFDGRHDGL